MRVKWLQFKEILALLLEIMQLICALLGTMHRMTDVPLEMILPSHIIAPKGMWQLQIATLMVGRLANPAMLVILLVGEGLTKLRFSYYY